MKFTYELYAVMLRKLIEKEYQFKNYKNWQETEKTVILRHDVDYNLKKAVPLSKIEKDICGGGATYFVLLSTDFYNVHSKESRECMEKIIENGGNIGLHFDETQYLISDEQDMKKFVQQEIEVLSDIVGIKVEAVSMHRPSKEILSSNIEFSNLINAYSEIFFQKMKYVSDSRRYWRENVDEIIERGLYPRLHILTHPFWYMEKQEKDLKETLEEAMLNAALDYYDHMKDNFRDLELEIQRKEIERILER